MIHGLVYLAFRDQTKLVPARSMRESYEAHFSPSNASKLLNFVAQSVVRCINRHFPDTRGESVQIKVDVDERTGVVVTQEAWCYFAESDDAEGVETYTIEVIANDPATEERKKADTTLPFPLFGLQAPKQPVPKPSVSGDGAGSSSPQSFPVFGLQSRGAGAMAESVSSSSVLRTPSRRPQLSPYGPMLSSRPTKRRSLHIRVNCREAEVSLKVTTATTIRTIFNAVVDKMALGPTVFDDNYRMVYDGQRLEEHHTVGSYGMEDGDVLEMWMVQKGGKPVIYLRASEELDAMVEVSLVPDWSFSALYPVVPTTTPKSPHLHQSARWDVKTALDGTMFDKTSGVQVSYLFWEALTNLPSGQLSPPQSPVLGASGAFRPALAKDAFQYATSVALDVPDVPLYLDAALLDLGLDTEARTSFITYWLPSFVRHEHVLLSFIPQSSYEAAAPLSITPSPDVVTRVFMIFRGIDEGQRGLWAGKDQREVGMWRDVVAVPEKTRQADTTLFRVLEWEVTCL
ncbi:p-loop containing nucleoside triphosphate hydrolase protein [Mycena chlorophos]|uniref:p-loop containing nucleoside triphosphate hydrolase protein n=1 Tax=Mycena chlorophos TaxID=658473 RepID=A0A8H6S6E7_MYCCL|nr:p-loop containing nucleoside triphosphate hydrolase protein [Mycena chlorophos]